MSNVIRLRPKGSIKQDGYRSPLQRWAETSCNLIEAGNAKLFSLDFDLTPSFLEKLYSENDGRCPVCSREFAFGQEPLYPHPIICRLYLDHGYIEGNIAILCDSCADLVKNGDLKRYENIVHLMDEAYGFLYWNGPIESDDSQNDDSFVILDDE